MEAIYKTKGVSIEICKKTFSAVGILLLTSCAVQPKKVMVYDEECDVMSQKLVLDYDSNKLFQVRRCTNEQCVAEVLTTISALTVETLVSGSVVGNAVYWFQKQGACREKEQEDKNREG